MFDLGTVRERRRGRKVARDACRSARSFKCREAPASGHDCGRPTDNPDRAHFEVSISPVESTRTPDSRRLPAGAPEPPAPEDAADAVAAIVDIILEGASSTPPGRTRGSAPAPPRALLEGSHEETSRLTPMQTHMQWLRPRSAAFAASRRWRSPTSPTPSWSAVYPDASAVAAAGVGCRGRRLQPRSRELAASLARQAKKPGSAKPRCRPRSAGRFFG